MMIRCSSYILDGDCGRFLCSNGRCVDSARVCDGVEECGDHSDELNCRECNCTADNELHEKIETNQNIIKANKT